MVALRVRDLYSSRAAADIIAAVKALDSAATVRVDLAKHRVEIAPSRAGAHELRHAIGKASFKTARPPDRPATGAPKNNQPRLPAKIPFEGTVDDLAHAE